MSYQNFLLFFQKGSMSFSIWGFSHITFVVNDISYYFLLIFFPLGFKGVFDGIPTHICHINIFSYFPKRVYGVFTMTYTCIHLLIFSHRVFQGAFWLITRPQEDQIDYKTTRRTNWSRGSVTKENRLSDQFPYLVIRLMISLWCH